MQAFAPILSPPSAAEEDLYERFMEKWQEAVENKPKGPHALLAKNEDAAPLLSAIGGASSYLSRLLLSVPDVLEEFLADKEGDFFEKLMQDLYRFGIKTKDREAFMRLIRQAKGRAALYIALADLSGRWDVAQVTQALSRLADTALQSSVAFLLREAAAKGDLAGINSKDPQKDCGYVVLGLGKLGGQELNYSSDIDLIVLYDPDKLQYEGRRDLRHFMVKMTQALITLMDVRTADGYVFRMDLRLRPDPGSTPVAITVTAAEGYYESFGQNWERAAMIKARPVAGDLEVGDGFLSRIKPFIWRKSLDFPAIADIKSIKRQIDSRHAVPLDHLEGMNIKLGHGGIREIEFFVQTQQLIWGGRQPSLRTSQTVDGLNRLARLGLIGENEKGELTAAYRFLRHVEHRLQMLEDAQTQTLPSDSSMFRRLALFAGFGGTDSFASSLQHHLQKVRNRYEELFKEDTPLTDGGNLVFTGSENDPATLETLTSMGYANPTAVSETVRGWHHGRYRAMRSVRARELLTELMPLMLRSFAETDHPDKAFLSFDMFLKALPGGVQVFSLFKEKPSLLDLFAEIMGDAPRLSGYLSQRPALLDAVTMPGFFGALPDRKSLADELDALLMHVDDYEDVLDVLRAFAKDKSFQVGVRTLRRMIDGHTAAKGLTRIADVVLAALLPHVEAGFSRAHGHIKDGQIGIMMLGKVGAEEMTAVSDLDLIVIYDAPAESISDGRRPLEAIPYYTRFVQRLVNAITAQTSEGVLWPVDMRLRPSGSAGPVAVSFDSFQRYQEESAWVWEHQALLRGRMIAGPESLRKKVTKVQQKVLSKKRKPAPLKKEIADMRMRMRKEHDTGLAFDLKQRRGGLVDILFIVQYLQLLHGASCPDILVPQTYEALAVIETKRFLSPEDVHRLQEAFSCFQTLSDLLSQVIDGIFDPEKASPGLLRRLSAILDVPPGADLLPALEEHTGAVEKIWCDLFGAEDTV